jgi:uncharacterized RDD family membrane protein YckC
MNEPTANPFTPPNASIDVAPQAAESVVLADRGQRFNAFLLDLVTILPAMILFGIGAYMASAAKGASSPPVVPMALIGLGGLYMLGVAIYQLVLLSKHGQTIGKRWMAIKIVKLDGSPPGFVHAVLLRGFVNGLIGAVPYLGFVYTLVDILMIFRDDRRCIHDMIASTRVVKAT